MFKIADNQYYGIQIQNIRCNLYIQQRAIPTRLNGIYCSAITT